MSVIIAGRVADSAGQPESGRIEFYQATRFDDGEVLVTSSGAVAQVNGGELQDLTGAPFTLPANPEGTAVQIREVLGGRTFVWYAAVPAVESVEYRDLPPVESSAIPESVWGPPPWLAQVQQMRDDTVEAIEAGSEVAAALGGLAGINAAVADAEAAAGAASGSAAAAGAEADRAEAAADSIDMTAINARLDGVDTALADKATKAELAAKPSEQFVLDAVAELKPLQWVESATLFNYGHSYTRVPSSYTSPDAGEYPLLVARRCGFAKVVPRGRGGTPLVDQFSAMLAANWGDVRAGELTKDRTWVPGTRGVVLMQHYMNEAATSAWGAPAWVDYWGLMLRSAFAYLSSERVIPASAGVYTGTWVDLATQNIVDSSYPGGIKRTMTQGSAVTFQVTGDEVWVLSIAATGNSAAAKMVATVGSTQVGVVATNAIRPAYTSVVDETLTSFNPIAIKLSGLNAAAGTTGTKTLKLTYDSGGSGSNVYLNGVFLPSANPPQLFYGLEPPRTPTSVPFPENDPKFRAKVAEIAPEFPNVTVVDLAPGWDNSVMISSLDTANPKFHPNDLGQQKMAEHFTRAIRQTITGPLAGVMTL